MCAFVCLGEKEGNWEEKKGCVLLFVRRVCLLVSEEEVNVCYCVVPRWRLGFLFL